MKKLIFRPRQFADAVDKYSRWNGILQEDLADRLGITQSKVSRIKNGALPDVETFITLCEMMDRKPSEFFKKVEGAE